MLDIEDLRIFEEIISTLGCWILRILGYLRSNQDIENLYQHYTTRMLDIEDSRIFRSNQDLESFWKDHTPRMLDIGILRMQGLSRSNQEL